MNCNCKYWFDVRCVCHPNKKTWKKCPVKAQTAYWLMFNDYDAYEHIEQKTIYRSKTYLTKKYKLENKDWEDVLEIHKDS